MSININYFFTTKKDGDVKQNKHIASKYNTDINNLRYMSQIHSDNIEIVNHQSKSCLSNCDGIISNDKDISLMVMVADCVPILIYDNTSCSIGAIHAGREGTFKSIVAKALLLMSKNFNANMSTTKVILGPSIHKCCYEVCDEIRLHTSKHFTNEYIYGNNIDLQGINKKQILDMGVREQNIVVSNICTRCDSSYFSYRGGDKYERFAGVIGMK